MGVAAVIVCYNGEQYIEKCIRNLLIDSSLETVIIIDNHSSDNSVNIIKENFTDVQLVSLESNVGFGQANNIGINIALKGNYDYVFLLNQDVYCNEKCVSQLVEVHQLNKEYGIIAPVQLDGAGKNVDVKFFDYLFFKNKKIGSDLINDQVKKIYSVDFVNAAAWLISRDCVIKVGGFDPIYFHTGEDDDYVERAKYWGFKIGIAPKIKVRHDRPQLSWVDHKPNFSRQLTLDIMHLKRNQNSFEANLFQLLKKKIYYILYDLSNFKFESAKVKTISFFQVLSMTSDVKESRKKALLEQAFLK